MLDYSQLKEGSFQPVLSEFDVQQALQEVLETQAIKANHYNIITTLTVQGAADEESPDALVVFTDRKRLQQVALSLVSNAIKYSPEGGLVEIEAAIHDGRLAISVRDQGIGISNKDQDTLFHLFSESQEDLKLTERRTGLGLYFSIRIPQQFGGSITCRSSLGSGSEFSFSFILEQGSKLQRL